MLVQMPTLHSNTPSHRYFILPVPDAFSGSVALLPLHVGSLTTRAASTTESWLHTLTGRRHNMPLSSLPAVLLLPGGMSYTPEACRTLRPWPSLFSPLAAFTHTVLAGHGPTPRPLQYGAHLHLDMETSSSLALTHQGAGRGLASVHAFVRLVFAAGSRLRHATAAVIL